MSTTIKVSVRLLPKIVEEIDRLVQSGASVIEVISLKRPLDIISES
ncbi:hypothetical protein [Pyrococcus kukulkanii]|uniref:Uncharacterized protein n=1 Tax=Pyrococcus kukulkanii TaxID=1609559 RepID=A0ABV4T552_9EURY